MTNPQTRLLILADETLFCKNLSIIFRALGCAVRTAPSGFSALDAIRDEIPDIILLDLSMPGMSGVKFLNVVRRRFPSIRLVAMSGEFTGTAIPAGVAADAFYEKGCHRPHLLLEAVEAMTHPPKSQAAHFFPGGCGSGA